MSEIERDFVEILKEYDDYREGRYNTSMSDFIYEMEYYYKKYKNYLKGHALWE